MKKVILLAAVLVASLCFISMQGKKPENTEEVLVLCGGSMRGALEELKKRYEKISDDKIVTTYGGSGELCVQIQKIGKGDLYFCHDPFMEWAEKQNLVSEWSQVAKLDIVIVTPKGNPKGIKTLKDLAKPGIRLGVGNQTFSSSGQIIKNIFKQLSYGKDIQKNVRVETKGHQQRCNDVVMGTLDASIVWDAVAFLYKDKLDIIPADRDGVDVITSATYDKSDLNNIKVTLGVITGSKNREAVRKFYEYVKTDGMKVLQEVGFQPPVNVVE